MPMNTNSNNLTAEEAMKYPDWQDPEPEQNKVLTAEEAMKYPDWNIAYNQLNYDSAYQAIREDNPLLVVPQNRMAEANSIVHEPDGPALAVRVAKKAALAQYFAKEGQYTMDEAYEYFDQITQKAFGRKMELNELWNTVRDIEAAKERPGIGERLTHDVASGFMQLNNRMQDITSLAVNGVVGGVGLLNYAVYKPLEFFARKAGFNELADEFEKGQNAPEVFQRFAEMFREVGQDNRKVLEEHMRERPSPEGAVEEIASALITTVPDWLFGIGVGAATGGAGSLAYFGVGRFAGEWGDTWNDPNMNVFQKIFNATFCATAEVVFERFGTLPLLKKYFSKTGLPQEAAKAFAGSVMNGFTAALKNIGIDVVKEGGSEAATGIVQRLTNTLMNKGGADIRKMSASQIYNEIVSPAWSEFAVGGVLAGGTAALRLPGAYSRYKNYAEGKKALNTFLGQGNELARNLAAKENPTDAEVAALDLLHDGMDQNDPYAVIQAQSLLAKEEFEKQQAMDQLSLEEQADIALLQAKELRDLQERRKTEVRETDIENSVRSLEDAARDYAEGAFTIVRTVDELPESVQKQFARVPESQRKNIEAVYDPASGKVHLIAERITPSRAAKVAFHEVAVHKGLREAMGDHYGLFLEKIGKDFAGEIENFRNSSRGQAYSFASDAEVIEEFLANVGEDLVNGADRTLIDRIIDALRKFLRKFPKFSQLRYTQRELENIILASADQIRTKSGRFNTDAAVQKLSGENAEGRFSVNQADGNGQKRTKTDVRFSVSPDVDTPAFKNWFGKSKVVDQDGKPLVVYHGSSADFTVFSHRFGYRNGAAEGRGFYFTSDKNKAEGYKTDNGKLFEVYLRLQKPLDPDKLSITKSEVEKIIRAIDSDGDYVANYDESGVGYPGKAWYDKAVRSAVNAIHDSSDDNADIVAEIYSSFGQGDALAKITEATGYDGFIKGDVYVVFNPAQIKSATDNVGTYDPDNPDVRFSLGNDSLAEEMAEKLSIRIMPIIRDSGAGRAVEAEIRTLLLEEGFNLDDAELKNIIAKAKDMVRGWQTRMRAKRDLDYLYEFDPYLNVIAGVYGDNFRIVPGEKYAGEEFTGTWINAKKNAVGIGPDEAARAVNAALGENITDDDIIDHFRDLRKKDILQKRNEEDRAFEEAMKTEELLRDQEMARAILHNEEPLTDEFIKNYPRAAKLVRDTFPNAEDWDAVRAGLQYNDVASWQEGRRTGRSEYRNLLKDAKKAHTDLKRVQELAVRYVKRNLPEEMQGAWLKRVADLAKYTPNPSIAYPNGRREFELQKLFDDLQGYEVKERIIQLADKYATKRNASGRPTAVLDEMQPVLENIRTALNLSEMAVQYMMEKNREKIAELEELGEDAQQLKDFNTVLSVFGALDKKSPEQLRQALDMLELVINGGLANFRGRMKQRMEQLRNARREVIDEAGGGTIGPTRFEPSSFFKTATAKHLGLKHLLYWISEKSGKDFSETWGGKMWQETEDSTWDEQRRIGKMQKDWEAILKEIGVNTVKEQREFMQELNKKVENSGVFKLQYSRENKDLGVPELRRKWTMQRISAKRARTLLADYDGGANPEMEDAYGMPFQVPNYSMEFLRRQLAAYDAGVDIMTEKFFGDPKDDAELARFLQSQKEDEKEKELVLIKFPKEESVARVQIPLTKDSAMHVWLSWQQKDVRAGMEFNGWTNESIQQLEKFLGPKYLDLAVKMRDRIRTQRQELDNAAREDYGVGLPLNENYFPASYKGSLGKEMKADALLGAQYGEMSMAPSFLIARKFHLNEVDTDSSAVSAFLGNQIEQAHYLAWRKTIREFKGVLNDRLVREAITQHYGKVVFDQLVDRIDTIAKGGRSTSDAVQEIAKFYKYWIPSKIALNFSSVAKQFAGVVNFVNDIPFKDFAEGYAESFQEGDLRNRFFDAVQKSDWLANRISGGLDKDLTFMLNSTRNIANYNPTATYLMDKVTLPTRWADTKSVLHGGYAVFKYHYNKMLKLTGDERKAWDEAMRQFQRSAEETQQSGALKDQNFYQSQAGMFRYLTAFMTNPSQIMAKEIQLINSLRIGTGARKESARKNLARMLVVNHLVMPILMEGITQFFRNGFDWDEYDFWDFLTGMLLGPFEAWLIAGKAVRAFSETLQREPSFGSVFQALPVIDDSLKGVSQIIRLAGMEDELEPDDWVKTVKALADLSLIAGSVAPGAAIVSAVGAGVSAGLREIRRIFRIFNSLTEED